MPRNAACHRCSLHEGVNTVCVWGRGNKQADIMLIGEAPGEEEDITGKPFQGSSGKQLDKCLEKANLSRAEVYVANAIKCRPPGNRDPTQAEISACFPYLAEEIMAVKPKVIVCVGRWALKALTGEESLSRARGRLLTPLPKIRVGDAKIIATFHPAFFLYSHRQSILDSIVEDLKAAQNVANPTTSGGSTILLPEGYKTRELVTALKTLELAKSLACDLEWLAIPNKERISWPWTPGCEQLSIAFSGRVDGELRTVALAWPSRDDALEELKRFAESKRLQFHNAMADVIWLLSHSIKPRVSGDSMLLSYLLDEQRRAGLKGLAPLVAGTEAGWEQKPWHRRPVTREGWLELLQYNADDTANTLRLEEGLVTQLKTLDKERANNIWRMYKKLLLRCIVPFAEMALVGVPIDEDKLEREIETHTKARRAAIASLSEAARIRPDAAERLAGSPQQVTKYAQEAYGLQVDSSREDALSDYVKQYPPLGYIQTFKHERKMLGTYLEPWSRLIKNQRESRLHSVYLLGATRTGRLSAEIEEGGSLLLTPRDGWARDLVSADPGWEIHAADYSQLELRIAAWLAPDKTMRRLYREGADLHTATAAFIKGFSERHWTVAEFWKDRQRYMQAVTKGERQDSKGINFGKLYGMQDEKFIAYSKNTFGVIFTLEEAALFDTGFFELYSDVRAWHERCKQEFYHGVPTLTPFGRYRFDVGGVTEQINTPIQATGSDLAIFSLAVIANRLEREVGRRNFEMIGFVHDCVLVHAKRSVRDEVRRIIQTSMEQPPIHLLGIDSIPVPLVAEVATGKTWASAKVLTASS